MNHSRLSAALERLRAARGKGDQWEDEKTIPADVVQDLEVEQLRAKQEQEGPTTRVKCCLCKVTCDCVDRGEYHRCGNCRSAIMPMPGGLTTRCYLPSTIRPSREPKRISCQEIHRQRQAS